MEETQFKVVFLAISRYSKEHGEFSPIDNRYMLDKENNEQSDFFESRMERLGQIEKTFSFPC